MKISKRILLIAIAFIFLVGASLSVTDALMRVFNLSQGVQYLYNIVFMFVITPAVAVILAHIIEQEKYI